MLFYILHNMKCVKVVCVCESIFANGIGGLGSIISVFGWNSKIFMYSRNKPPLCLYYIGLVFCCKSFIGLVFSWQPHEQLVGSPVEQLTTPVIR